VINRTIDTDLCSMGVSSIHHDVFVSHNDMMPLETRSSRNDPLFWFWSILKRREFFSREYCSSFQIKSTSREHRMTLILFFLSSRKTQCRMSMLVFNQQRSVYCHCNSVGHSALMDDKTHQGSGTTSRPYSSFCRDIRHSQVPVGLL
jgi:hypothetical protein